MRTFLKAAQQLGELRLFDLQFANHLVEINANEVPELLLAAALASHAISRGDTCLDLSTVGESGLYKSPELRVVRQKLPRLEKWREVLLAQKVVGAAPVSSIDVLTTDESVKLEQSHSRSRITPLILDDKNCLYLARYWMLEQSLMSSINDLLDRTPPETDFGKLAATLKKLFGDSGSPDWQKASVANAVLSNFCVITGGPGTGKTYTVTALLAALINQGVNPARIALAAPTGKASTRLTQSIQTDLAGLLKKIDADEAQFESMTLHKLIGARPGRVQPRHHSHNPLPYEVVIIDEASMIDLPMMARTFEALADDARLVLIGDKDQLHSVESGMVLGDICGGRASAELSRDRSALLAEFGVADLPHVEKPGGRIADHIIYLEKSHRVKDEGGINKLALAINTGDADTALSLFESDQQPNLSLLPQNAANLAHVLHEIVVPACKDFASAGSAHDALSNMSNTGVLCALRHGPFGAGRVNALVQKILHENSEIASDQVYYHGQPIMITENSNHQRLYNGDHGLVLADKNNALGVHFALAGNAENDNVRVISPKRLPAHETFYAMTIHKSQGSEYSTVVVVLPDEDSPILSRELLYTAVTRARSRVIVLANEAQLRTSIERRSVRQSGLREQFWTEVSEDAGRAHRGRATAKTHKNSQQVDPKAAPIPAKPAQQKSAPDKSNEKPQPPVQTTMDF